MTGKDIAALVNLIRQIRSRYPDNTRPLDDLIEQYAQWLEYNYPRFDAAAFRRQCKALIK